MGNESVFPLVWGLYGTEHWLSLIESGVQVRGELRPHGSQGTGATFCDEKFQSVTVSSNPFCTHTKHDHLAHRGLLKRLTFSISFSEPKPSHEKMRMAKIIGGAPV